MMITENPAYSAPPGSQNIIAFRFLAENHALCAIFANGDIVLFRLSGEEHPEQADPETMGMIDSGIKAASWSPDDEQVVIVTGDNELLVMSRDFETIHEGPLTTEEYGEDEMINVGWGSKQTQFHGSLGKSAAAQQESKLPIGNPKDQGVPTISWRGDGTYFCVSSFDPYSATSSRPGEKRRQVRIYTRSPVALSATSEPIYGMEGAICWRPVGNLIAVVQGFGWQGGAEGQGDDRGRNDVIFLEKNGLQHGHFRLREDERNKGKEGLIKSGQLRGSSVKQLTYNSDSEILAVWISRPEMDVGKAFSLTLTR